MSSRAHAQYTTDLELAFACQSGFLWKLLIRDQDQETKSFNKRSGSRTKEAIINDIVHDMKLDLPPLKK